MSEQTPLISSTWTYDCKETTIISDKLIWYLNKLELWANICSSRAICLSNLEGAVRVNVADYAYFIVEHLNLWGLIILPKP